MSNSVGRVHAACNYCHRQKIKCSGGQPCQRCRQRQRQCLYRTRGDRMVTISEDYLQRLNATLNELTNTMRLDRSPSLASTTWQITHRVAPVGLPIMPKQPSSTTETDTEIQDEGLVAPLVKDSTAESFVRKLKEVLQICESGSNNALPTALPPYRCNSDEASSTLPRRHADMRFDAIHSTLSFKLPPYQYAVQLISQAEGNFGDYHTFLRRSFWKRLHATYQDPKSQAKDRNWLCRLSFVFALAEGNNHKDQSLTITLDWTGGTTSGKGETIINNDGSLPPGTEYFEQGLLMLKVAYENPTVDDVEALNLASHCSFVLNRRRAAYSYAGQSMRLAHSLSLDKPALTSCSNLEREHRKRVWWTAFCVDRAISTELCLDPAYVRRADCIDYPNSIGLSADDLEEFFDPDLLTAQIKLVQIKADVIDVVRRLKGRHAYQPHELLDQCLNRLEQCRNDMPAPLRVANTVDIDSHIKSMGDNRVLFSLSLRYQQCYVLLLRPLLLHQLSLMLRGDAAVAFSEEVRTTNTICLYAARTNGKTMLHLARSGMLVIYGYWDSMHLFSCLTIMCLAKIMAWRQPSPFVWKNTERDEDIILYNQTREVLAKMVDYGNIPSKHHLEMLIEIESIGDKMAQSQHLHSSNSSVGESLSNFSQDAVADPFRAADIVMERELGFDDWVELLEQPAIDLTSFDIYAPSLG